MNHSLHPQDLLDLGCGSRRASLALESRGYRVTGQDITWEMVRTARNLCRDQRAEGLQRPSQATASPPTDRKRVREDTTSADKLLEARRVGMSLLGWHLRGVARTLRWRTWTGWIDAGRKISLFADEIGDTEIYQVSSTSTTGKVYYHLYQHEELVTDAKVGGFELLGYHSGGELNAGKQFAPRARQLDKQVLYAFRRL